MKVIIKLVFALTLVTWLILALPGTALAAQPVKVIVGGAYTLEAGETLDEDLIIVGGSAVLEQGSIVNGSIYLLGGRLEINGTVNGDVVATGGYLEVGESAVVDGDITSAGGYVEQSLGAQISGEVRSDAAGTLPRLLPSLSKLPTINFSLSPVWKGLWFLAQVLLLSALAVLIALFFPAHLERVDRTITLQPLIAGGMGLLTGFMAPFVALFLVITICLIPAAVVGGILLGLLVLLGWMAFGLEVGKRLGTMFKQEWTTPLASGVGTFVLTLVIGGAGKLWCIGWLFPTVVGLIGLGAAILTRFGTQDYPELVVRPSQEVDTSPENQGPASGGEPDASAEEQGSAQGV